MNNKDFSVTHRWVPPYTSSIDKTFSPGESRWITADVAALPDENATLCLDTIRLSSLPKIC